MDRRYTHTSAAYGGQHAALHAQMLTYTPIQSYCEHKGKHASHVHAAYIRIYKIGGCPTHAFKLSVDERG